jgi:hypothetical protein
MITFILGTLHFVSGLIILAEALNKLERTDPYMPGASARQRLVVGLKLLAWYALATGGAGALAAPLLALERSSFQDVAIIAGFATLIVRSRLKEERLPQCNSSPSTSA